jgi:hypothetical protein
VAHNDCGTRQRTEKITGSDPADAPDGNVERDEDCSIVVGSEGDLAGRDKVRVTGLPGDPPATMRELNAPEKTALPPMIRSGPILHPHGIEPSKIVYRCTMIS